MRIGYFAPSYRRPEKSITQSVYPFVTLVVAANEAEAYKANGNEVIECPNKVQGNLSRVRNWILDKYLNEYDCIVILDDDVSYIARWEAHHKHKMTPGQLEEFCEAHAILCKDAGLFFWGINCTHDKGGYREYTPFGFLQYIGGVFQAHMAGSTLRYDEAIPLKEDYDMTLQHIQKHRGCLRVNYAFYLAKQSKQVGGCATYRNAESEAYQFHLLREKWGSHIITTDTRSKRALDHNPIIKLPLRGV